MLKMPTNFSDESEWLFVAPVQGVVLVEESSLKIVKSTLVDRDYLETYLRIVDAEGVFLIQSRESNHISFEGVLGRNKTFLVCSFSGSPERCKAQWRLEAQKELDLLSSSQLGFGTRESHAKICLATTKEKITFGVMFINMQNKDSGGFLLERDDKVLSLPLNSRWNSYCENVFFNNLITVIRGETAIAGGWLKALHRSAILAGQSCSSGDLVQSFMWMFAALDTVLGDGSLKGKYDQILVSRAKALLGWCVVWEDMSYGKKIEEIYKKRSRFVHGGERDGIAESDLTFLDDLVKNILLNIVERPDAFATREKFHEYARKVEAATVLGCEKDIYIKTLRFCSKYYTSPPSGP